MLCPLDVVDELVIDKEALFASLMQNDRYVETEKGLEIELNVTFKHNSSLIDTAFDMEISNTADLLKANADVKVIIEGHTDDTGSEKYNQWLSDKRANAVANQMVEQFGVNPEQIETRGLGESQPVADNTTEEGRAQNRRVILIIPRLSLPRQRSLHLIILRQEVMKRLWSSFKPQAFTHLAR